MKKISLLVAAITLSLVLCGTLYAKYLKGFVVVSTSEKSVTIKDREGTETTVQTAPGRYKIGDEVRYDPKRNKLRQDVEPPGC